MIEHRTKRKASKLAAALVSMIAILSLTTVASAEPERATFDWGRVLYQLDQFVRTGAESPATGPPRADRAAGLTGEPYAQNPGNAWFGGMPKVVLVARDWATAYRLAGDRLSLVDAMRLSASTRMIVTRVRLTDARLTPFAQLGVGQWRVDTNLLPLTPRSTELAAQFGGGFELRLARSWLLACESTITALYREAREPGNVPQTRMWSTMLAARVEF